MDLNPKYFKQHIKTLDFWIFLEEAYKKNIKLDLGHFIILWILLNVNREYVNLIEKYGKKRPERYWRIGEYFQKTQNIYQVNI